MKKNISLKRSRTRKSNISKFSHFIKFKREKPYVRTAQIKNEKFNPLYHPLYVENLITNILNKRYSLAKIERARRRKEHFIKMKEQRREKKRRKSHISRILRLHKIFIKISSKINSRKIKRKPSKKKQYRKLYWLKLRFFNEILYNMKPKVKKISSKFRKKAIKNYHKFIVNK